MISAYRLYYAFDIAPSFWEKLKNVLRQDNVIILNVVKDEICAGGDDLTKWLKGLEDVHYLNQKREDIIIQYAAVLQYIDESPLYQSIARDNWSVEKIADPWLIAAASVEGGTIVTNENKVSNISNPAKNPHIPNVAENFGVSCIDIYTFMRKCNIVL